MSGGADHDPTAQELPSALQRWARTVFAAPRRLPDLITGVAARDEIIERLVTQVTRRDVHEVRTGTRERRSTASRLDRATIDPFAFTAETLRVESQHIAQCGTCGASGMARCEACGGTCTVACRVCGGSGKQASEKTGRPINCKFCKKLGRVPCGACTATGSVACRTCSGSGHQLAWLAFQESEHWLVTVSPRESPVALAHPVLHESRPLAQGDLSAFSIVDEQRSQGALDLHGFGEPYRKLPQAMQAVIDRRLERIRSQQYLRLAIVRRDVTYEMCGTSGTVVLSGRPLVGATTAEAVRPIRRRLHAWVALVAVVAVLGVLLRQALVGTSPYFDGAKQWSGLFVAAAVGCAVPAFGVLLRSWRGGARFHALSRSALATAGVTALALLGVIIVGLAVRPSASEVEAALTAGDAARARVVLEAWKERATGGEALDLEDRVMLAEAAQQRGQDRLKLLDQVAARKGPASAQATAAARGERLSQIRGLVQAKDSRAALGALDEWFRGDSSPDIAEERARAHEVGGAACSTDPCRWAAAVNANAARASAERAAQVTTARAKIWDSLALEQVSEKTPLPRLQQARQLAERAAAALEAGVNDAEVSARATAATTFAQVERKKVPLLGMDLAVAKELLGPVTPTENGVPMFSAGGNAVYAASDRSGKCTGLFAVGSPPDRRFASDTWPAQRILSQALGRPVDLKAPSGPTSQWWEGGVPIVARWRDGDLVELRIGDATP
jgi:hypothetical protein